MAYFPVSLELAGRQAAVIGGGRVAERRVKRLINAGAVTTVISPVATDYIKRCHEERKLTWKKKKFHPEDLEGAFIVMAATDDCGINQKVLEACAPDQLVNLADDPLNSLITIPSTLERGKLSISVHTSAASPGLSKKIVRELEQRYDSSYEEYVEFLFQARGRVRQEVGNTEKREDILFRLLGDEFLDWTRNRQFEKREQKLNDLIERSFCHE
ncbi:precorrin-2 dehydrogenase/sirohydrochlorin ferrochelatase family protein [Bacillus infantis]|uniref:precorrin-2 dehydrogenase/sirohydrochlorin ferrochelatase family protein n=1 Tax=Bacillus infantis TaxID=324767 RepID=UPI003CF13F51